MDDDPQKKFVDCLKSEEANMKFLSISNIDDANIMVTEINETLKSFATKSKIKVSKSHQSKQRNTNPWYDIECHNIKLEIEKKANQLKKDPFNKSIKESTYALKRKYKNTVKKKKKNYKSEIINKLNCTNKSSKQFWKLLDKLNSKRVDDSSKSGICAQKWLSHFKSVFTNDKIFEYPTNPTKTGPLDFIITSEELKTHHML